VIELSRDALEPLRKDEEFILYPGRWKDNASRTLVLLPIAEYPAPERLKRLEHEYSLREELDSAWAVRPSRDSAGGVPYSRGKRRTTRRSRQAECRGI
jgi:hypothetical protein